VIQTDDMRAEVKPTLGDEGRNATTIVASVREILD
jgi:hypothetical protein